MNEKDKLRKPPVTKKRASVLLMVEISVRARERMTHQKFNDLVRQKLAVGEYTMVGARLI